MEDILLYGNADMSLMFNISFTFSKLNQNVGKAPKLSDKIRVSI
jgi:hypothetical protein